MSIGSQKPLPRPQITMDDRPVVHMLETKCCLREPPQNLRFRKIYTSYARLLNMACSITTSGILEHQAEVSTFGEALMHRSQVRMPQAGKQRDIF
jgi:hypothetical protein